MKKKTKINKKHQSFHCGLHCAVYSQRHKKGKKAKRKKLTGLKEKKPIGRKKLMKKKKSKLAG